MGSAAIFVLCYHFFGPGIYFLKYAVILQLLLVISILDVQRGVIPNRFVLWFFFWLFIWQLVWSYHSLQSAALGFLVGGALFYVITMLSRGGMGGGDIKLMAGMDIAERRLPQDGNLQMEVNQERVNIRPSTLPTIYGEKLVLRLLRHDKIVMPLESLGFTEGNYRRYMDFFKQCLRYDPGYKAYRVRQTNSPRSNPYCKLEKPGGNPRGLLTL